MFFKVWLSVVGRHFLQSWMLKPECVFLLLMVCVVPPCLLASLISSCVFSKQTPLVLAASQRIVVAAKKPVLETWNWRPTTTAAANDPVPSFEQPLLVLKDLCRYASFDFEKRLIVSDFDYSEARQLRDPFVYHLSADELDRVTRWKLEKRPKSHLIKIWLQLPSKKYCVLDVR